MRVLCPPHRARPGGGDATISRPVLEEEIAAIARISGCVRLYSTDRGQDAVVEIAERLGMKVIVGIWLGPDSPGSRADFERGVAVGQRPSPNRAHAGAGQRGAVAAELSDDQLLAYVAEARARTRLPLSVADVPTTWLLHPRIAKAIDVLTVHVFPYWHAARPSGETAIGSSAR